MILEPHFRVGKITPVRIELSNDKRLLPTYSLWFNVRAQRSEVSKRVYLQERLDARSSTRLDWIFEPKSRGREVIAIDGLETQFPFGFLRNSSNTEVATLSEVSFLRLAFPNNLGLS